MRVPISVGLAYPERIECGAERLDLTRMAALSFEVADRQRYPSLFLSWDALRAPEGSTTVLNAANEVSVAAFLAGTIGFADIHSVNAGTIETVLPQLPERPTLEDLLALDERARGFARERVKERAQ
jgi:1-deoxy-D-xylulose-5-phosphate reductoisomerase